MLRDSDPLLMGIDADIGQTDATHVPEAHVVCTDTPNVDGSRASYTRRTHAQVVFSDDRRLT